MDNDISNKDAIDYLKNAHITVYCMEENLICQKAIAKAIEALELTDTDEWCECVKRPIGVKWSHSPGTTDLTCPICREVSKRSIFNNYCPNCGAGMVDENG